MANGQEEIVINPSERAVSVDIMRLQTFKATDTNELLRQRLDTAAGFADVFSQETQNTTTGSPASACIDGPGLMVKPQLASLDLFVGPGVIGILDPDAAPNPDESPYKFVRDPGVQTLGVLTMGANASGSTRIDVIECARVASPGYLVLETDSRDIFNPVSGTFSAATVNKVTATRLQYRVRQGAPGGGFPGTASGWVPLAVASVPNGTTTNDTVTFWDVRPLAQDRVRPPYNYPILNPAPSHRNRAHIDNNGGANAWLQGIADVDGTGGSLLGYQLGGEFLSIGTAGSIDLSVAANQSGAQTNNALAYVYLLEPFGLPRWAVYSAASLGPRIPTMRGIPVVSSTGTNTGHADQGYNAPSSPLALPLATGLAGTTSDAVCIAATTNSGGVTSLASDGSMQYPVNGYSTGAGVVGGGGSVTFTMTQNGGLTVGGYPACARGLLLSISLELTVGGAGTLVIAAPSLTLQTNGGQSFTTIPLEPQLLQNLGGAINYGVAWRVMIPVPANADTTWKAVLSTAIAGGGVAVGNMTIVGARL